MRSVVVLPKSDFFTTIRSSFFRLREVPITCLTAFFNYVLSLRKFVFFFFKSVSCVHIILVEKPSSKVQNLFLVRVLLQQNKTKQKV